MTTHVRDDRYIASPSFDALFITGGAFVTLALPLLVRLAPAALPVVFWAWVVLFEGSHFWATLSRTVFDRRFAAENAAVLRTSALFFAPPLAAVAYWKLTGSKSLMDLCGFAIFLWSLYHNARQHYGFASIYSRKGGEAPARRRVRTTLLYAAIVAPQLYFLAFHKGPLALSYFPRPESLGAAGVALELGCYVVSALAGLALLVELARSQEDERPLTVRYALVCWLFYSAMFYGVAPREPFFHSARNGAQLLMLLAVMNSLFHNIQYHAIVWHYARRRYQGDRAPFGLAAKLNGTFAGYALAGVSMGLVFASLVWGLGDWPALDGSFAPRETNPLAFVLFFGVIGQHFYLDQHIWRPSRQPELRGYLGVRSDALAAS
jgi:hypothetical protein